EPYAGKTMMNNQSGDAVCFPATSSGPGVGLESNDARPNFADGFAVSSMPGEPPQPVAALHGDDGREAYPVPGRSAEATVVLPVTRSAARALGSHVYLVHRDLLAQIRSSSSDWLS